ncbi:MAG: hypothetical protein ACYTA3_08670 [Planctomycetota bacterium]|jgi:hypothetical protein
MTEASALTPSPDEEARQAGLSPERLETLEEPDAPISPDIPVSPERPEPVVSAKPEAKAPARAKGRRRPRGGRRDARRLLGDSGLPDRLRIIVFDVVQRTRLWKSERADVTIELIGHFADGLSSGQGAEALEISFGSPPRAARLIRRAKRRQRPFVWKAWLRSLQVIGVLLAVIVAVYVAATVRLFVGRPNIAHDYLADLNAVAAAVAPTDRAWPLYRAAILELEEPPATLDDDTRPGHADWAEARAYLESQAEALEMLRNAASRPGLGFVAGYSIAEEDRVLWPEVEGEGLPASLASILLPYLAELRTAGRLLALDAHRAAEAGDGALATANVEAILGIARHTRETPILINDLVSLALVRMAVATLGDLLAQQPEALTDGQLLDLTHRLAAVQGGRLDVRLSGELLWFHDLMQRLYTDDGEGGGRLTARGFQSLGSITAGSPAHTGPLAPALGLVVAGRREMTSEYMRWFAMAEAEFAKPLWRQDTGRLDRERQRVTSSRVYTARYLPVALILPPLSRLGIEPELVTQERDAVCVAVGLELYRRRTGYWPASLESLVPDLLPMVPPDRFDGNPLRYRLVDGNPLVYSVGSDRNDDQGRAPRNKAGRWDPERARLVSHGEREPADGDWVLWPSTSPAVPDADDQHRAEQDAAFTGS